MMTEPAPSPDDVPVPEETEASLRKRIAELERQNRELAVLNTVVRSVNYRLNLQRILNDALEQVVSALNVKAGAIYLRSGDEMLLGAMIGLPKELQRDMERLSAAQVGELLRLRTINELSSDSVLTFPKQAAASGLRSWLAVELSTRELQAGLLLLGAAEPHRFGSHEIELVSSIADQLSIAVENACLFEETRRSLRRLEAINNASQAINSSLDPERVLETIAQYACELAGADGVGIYEWSADRRSLEIHIGYNLRPEFIRALRETMSTTPPHEDIIQHAIEVKKPIEIADLLATEGYHSARVQLDEGYRSLLAVPMFQGDEVYGVICLWWRHPHRTPMDVISLLATLANQSVSAIENARLSTLNEQIVKYMDEGILIENAEGQIIFANPRLSEMLGYERPEELIGQRILSWIDTSDRFVARQQHNAVLAGERRRYEAKFQTKNGSTIPVLASSTPVVARSGQRSNILTVVTDLSELKQLQERLLQSEKLSALGELVAGVAHELNNPLTSIIGYVQLIRAQGVSPAIKEDLERVLRQAQRAADIVRNLLAFARQEQPQRQYVDVNDVLERTLALRSYELRVQNIQVKTELDASLPRTMADPHQLQQVFLNLILNAEQAIVDSGIGSQIAVRTWRHEDNIYIEVADDGPGIPHELLGRIFDPFFTTKEQGKGTGLGLSISYGIVREHGGRIWAESEGVPGKGARFLLTLPITAQATPALKTIELWQVHKPEVASTSRRRILLIDDEMDIVEMAGRALMEHGYEVDTARNGAEALEYIQEHPYDLIVCDIKMPGMSGIELWNRLAERHPAMAKRFAFITGDVAGEKTAKFLRRVDAPALQKPFEVAQLVAFVGQVLDRQSAQLP